MKLIAVLVGALALHNTVSAAQFQARSSLTLDTATFSTPTGTGWVPALVWDYERSLPISESVKGEVAVAARLPLLSGDTEAVDVRELALNFDIAPLSMRVGIGRVFWGVTESRHLVDVINQSDYRFDPSGEVKLGQPLISATLAQGKLVLTTLLLPCHRPRAFPSNMQYRPRGVPSQDDGDHSKRFDCAGRIDRALRVSAVHDSFDVGIAYFDGRSRDPVVTTRTPTDKGNRGSYPVVNRLSFDGQWTTGSWLVKLEALQERRDGQLRYASVSGFEYIFVNIDNEGMDVSVLFEHLQDTRCLPFTCGNMWGVRLNSNDEADSQALLTALHDQKLRETMYLLQYERRLSHWVKMGFDGRRNKTDSYGALSLIYSF